ncbi:MAG TPA: DUF3857 domain-containing protein [Bacteroidales bacterium]|nr:DUF3857 domain-containing protein [Bacteroidales bacterium]HPT21043.1 DUF3857 domain-containing protein [Bacteroidales bacterium]
MKKLFFTVYMLLIVLEASSQNYSFESIPDNLKKRADAVVRSSQCLYTIIKPGNTVERVKKVITLINENSKGYRYLTVNYDKYSKINKIKGTIYDEKGQIIKVMGMSDAYDISAISGSSFYSDDRIKLLYFPIYKFPYTIEYEYEKEYTSVMNYPSYYFQDDPDVSVEKSGIQFLVPKDMILRFYGKNLKNSVDSVITSDQKIYTWQEENLPAIIQQDYFIQTMYNFPVIHTAPLDFEYGGYKGSMSSWKAFGEWDYNLIKGMDVLPQTEIDKVLEITRKTKDQREITKLIYEYVQSKTRYVSINIGIGGYRPAEASAVAKNGFGDCKALVNYTMALLKVAGINSYYTLVKAGINEEINENFVSNQFNHIILCVPMQKDTVWLECTNQTNPFNYLGVPTNDRYALLITPEGGKMVRTPKLEKDENISKRTGSITMYSSSPSLGKISNYYSGYNYDFASALYEKESDEEVKKQLYANLRFPDFSVLSVSFTENKSEKPSAELIYGVSINNFTLEKGSRLYFNPSLTKAGYLRDLPSALWIVNSDISSDSISYYLPYGYKVEYIPKDVIIENEFGKFRYKLEANNEKIVYKRYLELNEGEVPIEKFNELRNFINTIAKTDRAEIILKKS